jgi:hypothetical protein
MSEALYDQKIQPAGPLTHFKLGSRLLATARVPAGRGDVPLVRLRWRCARCRGTRIDMVVHSEEAGAAMVTDMDATTQVRNQIF